MIAFALLRELLDVLVPRFLTEDVACMVVDGHDGTSYLVPICPLAHVRPGEVFDVTVRTQTFNLFGFALFPRPVSEPRPFVNPHDAGKA